MFIAKFISFAQYSLISAESWPKTPIKLYVSVTKLIDKIRWSWNISDIIIRVQANTVNGVTGSENICNMWHDHFKNLLNSSRDTSQKEYVCSALSGIDNIDTCPYMFNTTDIEACLRKLKKGKSQGTDCVSSDHLVYAGKRVSFLSLLFIQ